MIDEVGQNWVIGLLKKIAGFVGKSIVKNGSAIEQHMFKKATKLPSVAKKFVGFVGHSLVNVGKNLADVGQKDDPDNPNISPDMDVYKHDTPNPDEPTFEKSNNQKTDHDNLDISDVKTVQTSDDKQHTLVKGNEVPNISFQTKAEMKEVCRELHKNGIPYDIVKTKSKQFVLLYDKKNQAFVDEVVKNKLVLNGTPTFNDKLKKFKQIAQNSKSIKQIAEPTKNIGLSIKGR